MPGPETEVLRLLGEVVKHLVLDLNREQLEQLAIHFALLLKWNRSINLTSIRDPHEIATRHFEESLFLTKLVPKPSGPLVDIGSGAGFPGLPLKIAWPDVETMLLEPNHKKATFLKEVVRSCDLTRVEVRAERLENVAHGETAGRAALATMRAVAPTLQALRDAVSLLSPEGQLALFISEAQAGQIHAPENLKWRQPAAIPHSLRRVVLLGSRNGS